MIGIVALAGGAQGSPIVYVFVFSFPLIAFACVFIHEAGHAIAGLATGGRVTSFLVVPFEIRFRPTSFRLRGKAESGDIGGKVKLDYAGLPRSRRSIFIMVGGGPAANLLVGIPLLFWVAHSSASGLAQGIAASVSWASIAMGLGNLCPYRRGRHATDGLQLWLLARTRDLSESPASPKSAE
ncbi:site-2 protease family protein [Sphingomonas oryzagri]|uniref:Site-2 protease family protein n=1 Tax=Sphingomonas oryzagri TaxID=3042314 RepID=A0ABT6MYH1_9SPHN|nr:site-2 protease family protein [Sphingomonas oryzagri]MDH7637992.1 site-2 protease family protein [Sphingomonas oryzagri]